MSDRVEVAVEQALKQSLTISEYEEFLQSLIAEAAVKLADYCDDHTAASYVKGVSKTLSISLDVRGENA